MIACLERELLTPEFTETVVRKVLTRAAAPEHEVEEERTRLMAELAQVRTELLNLTDALAASKASKAVLAALKDREARQARLEDELGRLGRRQEVSEMEVERLAVAAREKVGGVPVAAPAAHAAGASDPGQNAAGEAGVPPPSCGTGRWATGSRERRPSPRSWRARSRTFHKRWRPQRVV